jgi:hypothetical protein
LGGAAQGRSTPMLAARSVSAAAAHNIGFDIVIA